MRNILKLSAFAAITASVASPAMASVPLSAPAPVIGVGIPALIGLAYAYKKIRDRRSR